MAKKSSFFSSIMAGTSGFFSGVLTGGLLGAVLGAAVGALAAVVTGDVALIGVAAAEGAQFNAILMGAIGGIAGTVTGVVKHREAAQPSAQDVVDVAKVTFLQGVQMGHAQAQEQEASKKWQDKIAQQRGAQVAPNQVS